MPSSERTRSPWSSRGPSECVRAPGGGSGPADDPPDLSALLEVAAIKMSSTPATPAAHQTHAAGGVFTDVDLRKTRTGVVDGGGTADDVRGRKSSLLGGSVVMDAATKKLLSAALAEALGLGMVCFFGCAGTLNGPLGKVLPHIQVALTFAFVVMIAIACFAHVSGAHFNPAVTVMAVIMKVVDIRTGVVYIVAQIVGGSLGYGMLKLVTPSELLYWNVPVNASGPCCTVPHPELSTAQAVLVEMIATGALLALCCSVWDPRNAANTDGIPVKFGLLIGGIAMCMGPYTGASMNPARTLAPAIWENTWTDHWIYWVGPLSAAVIMGYGWPLVFSPIPEPRVRDHADVPLTLVSAEQTKRHSKLADDDNGDVKAGY